MTQLWTYYICGHYLTFFQFSLLMLFKLFQLYAVLLLKKSYWSCNFLCRKQKFYLGKWRIIGKYTSSITPCRRSRVTCPKVHEGYEMVWIPSLWDLSFTLSTTMWSKVCGIPVVLVINIQCLVRICFNFLWLEGWPFEFGPWAQYSDNSPLLPFERTVHLFLKILKHSKRLEKPLNY